MKRLVLGIAAAALLAAPAAHAALAPGAAAPDFTLQAALGGKDFTYDLGSALKKGPAVVYFYPKAFTKGCSAEAHEFADKMDQFKALGATVIGVSGDNIKSLEDFSQKDCGSKFPVAADPTGGVIKKYDVYSIMVAKMTNMDAASNRTSYLVAPDGTVIYAYSDLNASKHVENLLAALKAWRETHKA